MRGFLLIVSHPRRVLAALAGLIASLVYVWYASVRAVPGVRHRKAAARRAWRLRPRKYQG